jgi:hypothetical protein
MGRTARDSSKTDPIKARLSQELLEQVERAWKSGYLKNVNRQDFIAVLIELGLERYERGEYLEKKPDDDPEPKHSDAAGET